MSTEQIMAAAGAIMAAATLGLFLAAWLVTKRKIRSGSLSTGDWMDGLGFGLLPALTVGKLFEEWTRRGRGIPLMEPVPSWPYVAADEIFHPCRIEWILLLLGFLGMCLWRMVRREGWETRGDLAGVSGLIWAGVRTATEMLRTDGLLVISGISLVQAVATLLTLGWMIGWTSRLRRNEQKSGQAVLDWLVAAAGSATIWLLVLGIVSTGSSVGDWVLAAGCGAIRSAAAMELGGESRKGYSALRGQS